METITLDLKDRKILYILSQEARTPPSAIAKQVSLSKDAVKYRIKQMEKKGIIVNYITEIDTYPLRYTGYDIFLRFNIPPKEEYKIAEFFNTHPNTLWSCYTSGEWDYFAEMICSDNEKFHELTLELAAKFGNQLVDYDFYMVGETYRITQIIESVYDGKGIDLKGLTQPHEFPAGMKIRVLDTTEKKMLKAMADEATLPIHKIAKKSGLTSEIVRYRLRKLRQEGIVLRTTPVIDYHKLGLDEYIIIIDMKNISKETENQLRIIIQHNTGVKYAFRALGKMSVIMLINTKSMIELENFIKELKLRFHNIIKSARYLHVTHHQKFTLFPEILRQTEDKND